MILKCTREEEGHLLEPGGPGGTNDFHYEGLKDVAIKRQADFLLIHMAKRTFRREGVGMGIFRGHCKWQKTNS